MDWITTTLIVIAAAAGILLIIKLIFMKDTFITINIHTGQENFCEEPKRKPWHPKVFINKSYKLKTKGVIMEGNVKVDQRGLLVFDSPKDKYGNATSINGEAAFSSSDDSICEFRKATQGEIDEFNNDPATVEGDKIPEANFPFTGAWKSKETVGAALLKISGDPSEADNDQPAEGSFTMNVGAGGAVTFGNVQLKGAKDDDDDN